MATTPPKTICASTSTVCSQDTNQAVHHTFFEEIGGEGDPGETQVEEWDGVPLPTTRTMQYPEKKERNDYDMITNRTNQITVHLT